jgi:hypothetical protein
MTDKNFDKDVLFDTVQVELSGNTFKTNKEKNHE